MSKKRILSAALMLFLVISVFNFYSCGGDAEETVNIKMKITGADNDLLYDREVSLTGSDLTVLDALKEACADGELTLDYDDLGFVDQIGNYIFNEKAPVADEEGEGGEVEGEGEALPESTEDVYMWEYKLNGTLSTEGTGVQIKDGDSIEFFWTIYVPEN